MSEQGLREAVDDLRAWCDMQREAAGQEESEYAAGEFLAYKRVRGHLLNILADHPTGSAPQPVEELVGVLTDPDWGKAPRPVLDREAVKAVLDRRLHGDQVIDMLMELARPMPTREQIAEVLREHLWIPSESRCSCGDEHIEFVSHHQAEAVLALLNGSES